MGKWLDLAARLEAESVGDNRDNRDISPGFAPNGPIVPNVLVPLPPSIIAGLARLRSMAAPKSCRSDIWPRVVSDVLRLAKDGWAAKALALGWSSLDLFGAVTDPTGDPHCDGLAVWLAGRPMLAICSTFATVSDGAGRAYFARLDRTGARLLWDLS